MNKKVLTLCAGFLLAGSLTAVAQYCPQNGEVDYRTRLVKSAMYDAGFEGVKAINPDYYYQLQVKTGENGATQVLTVERDYSTGKLYLTAQKVTDATLTHSLWQIEETGREVNSRVFKFVNKETGQVELALYVDTDGNVVDRNTGNIVDRTVANIELAVDVDESADAESPINLIDQVRSWVVASGQTLREVLQDWCNKEGWDLVWATSREYPIEASAVFKGRFVDVASALVRNFARATPVPYAKFYKGNRVLVVSTTEE